MSKLAERRTLSADFEVRNEANTITVEGYASTFNQPYDMGFYSETIAQGAFTKTLSESPDVRFLLNHDGLPLARTTSGTLELSQDSTGLAFRTTLDANDPDVARLVPKMQRGDLNQCSFAFRTIKDSWNEDYTERTMSELSLRDGDVSVVTYPANPAATAKLRAARDTVAAAPLLARVIADLNEGRAISNANMAVLEKILVSIAAADVELDQAQADLAAYLGIENPDDDHAAHPSAAAVKNGNHIETEETAETPAEDVEAIEPKRSLAPSVRVAALHAAKSALKAAKHYRD
jgi:HK97 family phage prohead protease